MRFQRIARLVALGMFLLPAAAWAQSSITGVVKDTSGAVLPGVTVEASSPALIAGSSTAVTDSQGLYRIVDLRPGPYTVTFTLPGFATIRRDGGNPHRHGPGPTRGYQKLPRPDAVRG
jgi:hypothetical protein